MPFSTRFSSEHWKAAFSSNLEPFVMGAFATAHIVSSLRYFWNELKVRRKQKAEQQAIASSLYARVVSGECHHGWEIILPAEMIPLGETKTSDWAISFGFSSVGNNNATRFDHVLVSVTDNPSPNGQRIQTLRMWSRVCPEVNATILRISCRQEDWSAVCIPYLDDSNFGVLFHRAGTPEYRLVICSTYRQGHLNTRKYDLQSPFNKAKVILARLGSTKNRLFVLFARFTWNDFEDNEQEEEDHDAGSRVLEYILASYDLLVPNEPDNRIHYPLGCEGISIPIGTRYRFQAYYPVIGENVVSILHNGPDATNDVPPLCITFKANRCWTVDTIDVWAERLSQERDSTDVSMWKVLEVMRSFWRLDVPESLGWTTRLPLVGTFGTGDCHGNDFFVVTQNGLFRRRINPPSLKQLAAEALFRSNPILERMKRSELKQEIGIDVFEGIPEENEGEHEIPMIHL